MTLATPEFIRRFLLHTLPHGFHRIRHYGLLAAPSRKASLALARTLLAVATAPDNDDPAEAPVDVLPPCPCCGAAWSSSRPSPDGSSLAARRRRHPQPERSRYDPARPTTIAARRACTSDNGRARLTDCHREPARSIRRQMAPIRRPNAASRHPVRICDNTLRSGSAKPLDQPNRKNPIAQRPRSRGFVPRRLSYACRRPKLFTGAEGPVLGPSA